MHPPKLLDQVRAKLRVKHYAIRTEQSHVDWIKRYVYSHDKSHPKKIKGAKHELFIALVIIIPIPLPFILHRRWRFVIILLRPATWLGLPLLSSHGFDLCIEA